MWSPHPVGVKSSPDCWKFERKDSLCAHRGDLTSCQSRRCTILCPRIEKPWGKMRAIESRKDVPVPRHNERSKLTAASSASRRPRGSQISSPKPEDVGEFIFKIPRPRSGRISESGQRRVEAIERISIGQAFTGSPSVISTGEDAATAALPASRDVFGQAGRKSYPTKTKPKSGRFVEYLRPRAVSHRPRQGRLKADTYAEASAKTNNGGGAGLHVPQSGRVCGAWGSGWRQQLHLRRRRQRASSALLASLKGKCSCAYPPPRIPIPPACS